MMSHHSDDCFGSRSRFMTNSMLKDWISRQVSTTVSY
jgi:hypothetical protein